MANGSGAHFGNGSAAGGSYGLSTGYQGMDVGGDGGEDELPRLKIRNKKSKPLHRNQACITCRGRKVRCDATKPGCGACRRSAAAHGEDPDLVVCEYDDEEEVAAKVKSGSEEAEKRPKPKKASAKLAALEEKIAELERLIAEHNIVSHAADSERSSSAPPQVSTDGTRAGSHDTVEMSRDSPADPMNLAKEPRVSASPLSATINKDSTTQSVVPHENSRTDPLLELFWPGWPSSLPHPNIVSHVTNIFLNRTATGRFQGMLDPAVFRNALTKPPGSAAFPHLGLIHAMMAVAYQTWGGNDLATQLNGGTPYWLKEGEPQTTSAGPRTARTRDEIRRDKERKERLRQVEDYHAAWALRSIEESLAKGAQMFQMSQAVNVICWFYYLTGKFVEAWVYCGLATRIATPLGLNHLENCPAYQQGEKLRARSLMPPPTTLDDKFHRSITFWLAFQADRFATAASGWPSSIDERDVSTLLPSRPGTSTATLQAVDHRTHPLSLSNPNFFSEHPPDVEEFQIELKATVLLGRVTSWLRRAPAAMASFASTMQGNKVILGSIPDMRQTNDFVRLDQAISTMRMNTPRRMLDIRRSDGSIDQSRLLIIGIPHSATILLYEPFATRQPGDPAHDRCMQSARAILNMTFALLGSNADFRNLYCFSAFSWTAAGRTLVRDYALKELAGDTVGMQQVRGEIDVILLALESLGQYARLGLSGAHQLRNQFKERQTLLPPEQIGGPVQMQGVSAIEAPPPPVPVSEHSPPGGVHVSMSNSSPPPSISVPNPSMDFRSPFDHSEAFIDPSWAALLPRAPDGSLMSFDNFPTDTQLQELDVNFLASLMPPVTSVATSVTATTAA